MKDERQTREDRVLRALELLCEELEALSRPTLWASGGRAERPVPVRLELPTTRDPGVLAKEVERLRQQLLEALATREAQESVLRPGRVYCLRCASAECEHSRPLQPTRVFAGYGPSGMPEWVELGQYLLDRRHPEVDRLWRGQRVTHVAGGAELTERLLPAFRDRERGHRLLGQVVAGWYRLPRGASGTGLALTFQGVAVKPKKGPWCLALNVVAGGVEEESSLLSDHREEPWEEAVDWARRAFADLERSWNRGSGRSGGRRRQRARGILEGLARRLRRTERSRARRTEHAEQRKRREGRPVHKALSDLERARRERVFVDEKAETMVVVGARGRTHVFSREGRLVTSMHLEPSALDKRRRTGRWREGSAEELEGLRRAVGRRVKEHPEELGADLP